MAYKKAKAEAFYESTHFHALAFTQFEQNLHSNIQKLQKRILNKRSKWFNDNKLIGDYGYLPKSVNTSVWDSDSKTNGHFAALNPELDWENKYRNKGVIAPAFLRLIIRPTVEFQIISALWIIHVGTKFDSILNEHLSFGNRLRKIKKESFHDQPAALNLNTPTLFAPYFSAYQQWRENGLMQMEKALGDNKNILAITMDIEKFYHRVSPNFLLREEFLSLHKIVLNDEERSFTSHMLEAINVWYRTTPDYKSRPDGAIPVGLSASKIISNVLLAELDRVAHKNINPLYYGRYVDDIFLVIESNDQDTSADSVSNKLINLLSPLSVFKSNITPNSLELKLSNAKDSTLIFSGDKQKIFSLSSAHGSDLVHQIRYEIRERSSEYRLLPMLPKSGMEMVSKALLSSSNAAIQGDSLRKTDAISIRRLGFSMLLSDVETYSANLRPETWESIRYEFFELAFRHIITPQGFFDFFNYIPRVFGVMLSCGDLVYAKKLIAKLENSANLISNTTTLGLSEERRLFSLCLEQYSSALLESGLQAATARNIKPDTGFLNVLKELKRINSKISIPRSSKNLETLVKQILFSDWGRRPYKDFWLLDQQKDESGPQIPRDIGVKRQLRLGGIRIFQRKMSHLKTPYWPALAFPTRPLRFEEIGLVAPIVLSDPALFKATIRILRGAQVPSPNIFGHLPPSEKYLTTKFNAPGKTKHKIRIAVASIETNIHQLIQAMKSKQDRSLKRYENFNSLINKILKENKRADYIVLPELCIPLKWAIGMSKKLSSNGISLICGVEYHQDRSTKKIRNDCLISLTTNWPGYRSHIILMQSKFKPAHSEIDSLKKHLGKNSSLYEPTGQKSLVPIYNHNGFLFSVLICSDLTNISHRNNLRGEIDALFTIEWNKDTKTFSPLVESTANDLHCFVIQANNRLYGDSRIRAPANNDYERDIVQVKGGVTDFYVLGEIDFSKLRREQHRKHKTPHFKPVPIGFNPSSTRKPKK